MMDDTTGYFADTTNIISGDTMYVAASYLDPVLGMQTKPNALRDAVLNDTGATATDRANINRVYVLKVNEYYYLLD